MLNKNLLFKCVIFALLLAFTFFIIICLSYNNNNNKIDVSSTIPEIDREPIADFNNLKQVNDDVYAWIHVPNTNIDYPILQHKSNDEFYLHHNIFGKYEYAGVIYSEKKHNSKDFTDRNTILYGHNMTKGYMFENLHKFQDQEFFNENTEFYIYTSEKKLTYEIVSAFQHSNQHIMYYYNFNNDEEFNRYVNIIKEPKYSIKNVRQDINITNNDNLVTLSTCLGDGKVYRYLVVGVLRNVENL